MLSIKGFGRHKNGKAHPVHEKKGVDENSFSVTEKGMNDKIEVKIDPVKKQVKHHSNENMRFNKISEFIMKEKETEMKGMTEGQRELEGDNIETDIRTTIKGYEDLLPYLDRFAILWSNLEPYLKRKIIRIGIPELTDKNVQTGLEKSDFNKLPLYDRLVLARGMQENLPKSDFITN